MLRILSFFSPTRRRSPRTGPSLSDLPPELLLEIAAHLGPGLHDLNSLLRTTRRFAHLLSPVLLKLAVTARDRHTGRSLLHWAAASNGNISLMRRLLESHADVNAHDLRAATPLHSAVLRGHTAGVELLLQNGADAAIKNSDGWAALHLAAITGNRSVAALLLHHGADAGARSKALFQKTPLHYAVMLGHVAVAELLIAHGADIQAKDGLGVTVAQKAVMAGHERVVVLLFGAGTRERILSPLLPSLVDMEITMTTRGIKRLFATETRSSRFTLAAHPGNGATCDCGCEVR